MHVSTKQLYEWSLWVFEAREPKRCFIFFDGMGQREMVGNEVADLNGREVCFARRLHCHMARGFGPSLARDMHMPLQLGKRVERIDFPL